jgi:histidinol-phosphate aminotransferase
MDPSDEGAGARFDVCNGDADGLCAVVQWRLHEPAQSTLVTGLKRQIALLDRVDAVAGDEVLVCDLSMERNREALLRLLGRGVHVRYFDHHAVSGIPRHPHLDAHIDLSAGVCTSVIVDRFLEGAFRAWAAVGAHGDNLHALGERLAEVAINRYPSPAHDELAQAIRARFAVPDEAGLVLGNGSDELITMLAVATARPGAVHLAPQPSFVMYELSARLAGSRFVGVPLRADFSLDVDAMLSAIAAHRPAVVWLAWPNNPTGNAFAPDDVEAVLAAAPGLVVLDEAYQPFAQDTWMQRLRDNERLVVLRTVSKLGLAGLRLGYLAAAPQWVEHLQKVRPPYNVNVLTDAAARFALEHLGVLDAQAARIRAGRDLLAQRLQELPGVEVFPSRANFVLVRVADSERTERGLRSRGLLIKDLGRMHDLLRNCLRLTVGTEEENRLLLEALRDSL